MWRILEWLASYIVQPLFPVGVAWIGSFLIRNELYWWLIIPAVVVVLGHIIAMRPWWMKPATVSTLLRVVRDMLNLSPDEDVRCAIFRPTVFRKELVEVVMATEGGEQQRKNRVRMKISQGEAGRAYRTGQLCYVPITGDWRTQLMTEFGFTDREISKFRSDRKSYLCVPILGEHDKVLAVLSFDSKYPDSFTPDRVERIDYMASYFSAAISGE